MTRAVLRSERVVLNRLVATHPAIYEKLLDGSKPTKVLAM